MIYIKTREEIEGMKKAGEVLARIHIALRDFIVPGITTEEIDRYVEELMKSYGATPEQKGYQGYPFTTCTSVNDEICHGYPGERVLMDDDIVVVDMVVNLDGYLADSAWCYGVGEISEETKTLMDVTKNALYLGIEQVVVGNRIGDIGHAIQTYVEAQGFSVVREFVGHGIGKDMHEDPQVPHYGKAGRGIRLQEGMVITVEPMINVGAWKAKIDDNGWTARTIDGKKSCQYEHTMAIVDGKALILTDQDAVEKSDE
jgi:methionyl aminopeptidase